MPCCAAESPPSRPPSGARPVHRSSDKPASFATQREYDRGHLDLAVTNKRDNEAERTTRIDHILSRLAASQVESERIQERARRMWSELQSTRQRRAKIIESVKSVLKSKLSKRPSGNHRKKRSR
jgi:hypothetical protein